MWYELLFWFSLHWNLGGFWWFGSWKDAQVEEQEVIAPYEEIFVWFSNIHNLKLDLLIKTSLKPDSKRSLKIVCHAPLGLKSLKY